MKARLLGVTPSLPKEYEAISFQLKIFFSWQHNLDLACDKVIVA